MLLNILLKIYYFISNLYQNNMSLSNYKGNLDGKVPLYLSIHFNKSMYDINLIFKKYNISLNIHDTMNFMPFDDFHTTTYYLGRDKNKMFSKYYKEFIEGKNIKIKLDNIVYVENLALILKVSLYDKNSVLIENKFPHISLMGSQEFEAFESNYILKLLKNDFNKNFKIKIFDYKEKNYSAFITKLYDEKWEGVTRINY